MDPDPPTLGQPLRGSPSVVVMLFNCSTGLEEL